MTPGALRRAFVAVEPPDDVRAAVALATARARPAAGALRWMPPAQWHLTIRFLGRVDDAGALLAAVRDAVTDVAPFELALGGVGAFPSLRRGTTLWVGVREGADPLGELAGAVGAATAGLGEPEEPRPFRAHLTLARSRQAVDLRAVAAAVGDEPIGPSWTVGEVVVFQSDTRSEGAVHQVVARVPLS